MGGDLIHPFFWTKLCNDKKINFIFIEEIKKGGQANVQYFS